MEYCVATSCNYKEHKNKNMRNMYETLKNTVLHLTKIMREKSMHETFSKIYTKRVSCIYVVEI